MLLSTVCLALRSGKEGSTHDVPADGRNNSEPSISPPSPPVISTATKIKSNKSLFTSQRGPEQRDILGGVGVQGQVKGSDKV